MRRSGAMTAPATMQWGHPQPRSGEGAEAMKRSGAMTAPATMQSKDAMWGHLPLAGERSGAGNGIR
jgi:hypothetical protein